MVTRRQRIRFFRASPRRVRDAPWPNDSFPRDELRAAIESRISGPERYVDLGDQTVMALSGHSRPAYFEWSCYHVRQDELPDEETDGVITPLALADISNLAEGSHLVMFERNIVGMLGRRGAPGRAALCTYVEAVLERAGRSVRLDPVIRPDVMALLSNAELVAASIRVAAGNAQAIAAANSTLGGAARDLSQQSSARSVEFTLRAGPTRPERTRFRRDVLRMVRPVRDMAANRVEKLQVTYISDEAGRQIVDLLGDDITVNIDVDVDARRRSLPPEEAYEAIHRGYNESLPQLNQALELG